YLDGLVRRRIVKDGDLVAVLISTFVDGLLHLCGRFFRQGERLYGRAIVPFAHGDLRNGGIHHRTFKLRVSRLLMRLDRFDDDRDGRVDYHWRRNLRRRHDCCARAKRSYDKCPDRSCNREFHSTSSVAMRSDLRKRTSWGVIVKRACFNSLSAVSCIDSWST